VHYNHITMVMDTIQVRLAPALLDCIDALVKRGVYGSRSDAIREAVRHLFWHQQVGTVTSLRGNSVKLVRKARKELSKQPISLDEINSF